MITFPNPWLFTLLPLPFLVIWLVPGYRAGQSSVRVPRLRRLASLSGKQPSRGAVVFRRSILSWVMLMLAWGCAVTALARPQWIGEPISRNLPSRDLLLAVDLSGSMSTEDFVDADGNRADRLTACKQVLDDFLTRREGDRVGLIFFGSAAFVQSPFTEDLELCRTLLDEAQVGMAGPQTVIGDAVGLSLTVFDKSEQEERVLILLTDGNDTGSKVTPREAAVIAKDKGVTIHSIAVGDPEAVGEEKIDEETLQDMSGVTGGKFFRAEDRDELEQIYAELDAMAPKELEVESYLPKTDLYFLPLIGFMVLGLAYHGFFAIQHFRQVPKKVATVAAAVGLICVIPGAGPAGGELFPWAFHFLRPGWLLLVIPAGLILMAVVWRSDGSFGFQSKIDPHLLKHLMVRPDSANRIQPVHLLAIAWCLGTIGIAGPTWQREPSPFASDQAVVVFVQEVSPTMMAQDIQPSRLQRSVHKIRDLLAIRPGTDAALVAYSGSAHLVMPITGDANIIESFASELSPGIMPRDGDAAAEAILLANQILETANRSGSIVLLTDGINENQNERLLNTRQSPVSILAMAGDQSKPLPLSSPPAPAIDLPALKESAKAAGGSVTVVTPDDADVQEVSRNITTQFVAAEQDDGGERWKEFGYWLTPLITLICLYWFRQGWMIKWE